MGVIERHKALGEPESGKIVDLSAPLGPNTYAYPADPQYRKTWHARLGSSDFDSGSDANVSKVEMGLHCGSHVDAPLHFLADGRDVASMPLEMFFGPAVAIDCPKLPGQDVTAEDLAGVDVRRGDIVLFRTGWEERSGTAALFEGQWPGLSVEVIETLIARGVKKAVGGDIVSADSPAGIAAGAPAHVKALTAGMVIFEGLINLKSVVGKRFTFIGLPLKIVEGEASPVRAIAVLDADD
ncbi:MAG: cyclase family protein [Planctomycetes bacterium]|nr:cyclase family protein [Planctomycetota bacterium]